MRRESKFVTWAIVILVIAIIVLALTGCMRPDPNKIPLLR